MLLFKNSAKTMEGVLSNAKHATDGKTHNVKPGDIILIAQTKNTLLPGQKQIRWIMNFVSCEEDVNNLSDKIWGKHWRYLINGDNIRSVEPFDINDIKITSKNYDAVQTYAIIEPEDEEELTDPDDEELELDELLLAKEQAFMDPKSPGIAEAIEGLPNPPDIPIPVGGVGSNDVARVPLNPEF